MNTILARDNDGNQHRLRVDTLSYGLVTVYDDGMTRVLHPAAAVELGLALIHAVPRGAYKGIVGPISGGF